MGDTSRFEIYKNILLQSPEHPFGKAIVEGLCEAGANVYLCGEDESALCAFASYPNVQGIYTYSPGNEDDARKLVKWANDKAGIIDAFVHISPPPKLSGWVHDFDAIYDALRSSQLGLMLTVKHVGKAIASRGRGSVVFVTDYSALVGVDEQNCAGDESCTKSGFALDYGFVKGSYVNYARQAAGFLGEHNVRCNAIAFAPQDGSVNVGFKTNFIRHSHLKRLASDADIQSAVQFLISDASSYITGTTLTVDGGYTAK